MTDITAGVFLGHRRVGTLSYRAGSTWFDYEDREPEHPVLGQAFEANPRKRRSGSGSVPEWFANLLPETGSGLRNLIGRELGRSHLHDFQVLLFLGEDLPGNVRVVPEPKTSPILDLECRSSDDETGKVRFSLAGVQAKFSMRWEGKGLVLPMSGRGGDWIVKLPDRRFPEVPANEYAMLTWAKLAGVDVPDIRLLTGADLSGLPAGLIFPEENAFAVRRFDRPAGHRVHQEDFAQIREVAVASKYEKATYTGLARFIKTVCPQDIEEYLRRLASIVVMGNLDAHLKNWTLRYPDGITARLSPAYDFVSVSAYEEFRAEELAFPVNGGRIAKHITLHNFRNLARRADLDPDHVSTVVADTVTALLETWPQAAPLAPAFVTAHIEKRLRSLPLVKEVKR
ncbi:type II toxin-antitoxin system HipA family toxin [Nonomuraea sp. MCN248]|uniref:Type II toxin-antitoxin system HipA family toxin n=1 Tax=Nonomuraea corallina TaxID=2989783 RepID=A0ABT4SI58_9ACTN|nr:type II toxin-antitoxin system HipA family toxin [Nonomuraea corallina]MDA0636611.1 type II toxin-antitoxin system HipA family toxin [Nonomuraea corallina]